MAAGRVDEAAQAVATMRQNMPKDHAVRDELRDVCVRVDAFCGRFAGLRDHMEARLALAIRHGDGWRETVHRVYLAWDAVEHEDEGEAVRATEAMLTAYDKAPQEEAMTTLALEHVATGLRRRGQMELATRVQALVDTRREAIRVGFTR
jgi:hypothetical protein